MFRFLRQKRLQSGECISGDYLYLASTYSNKLLVKNIVQSKCSDIKISKIIAKCRTFDDVITHSEMILEHIPFVIKVSHWSGDAKVIRSRDDFINNITFLRDHFNRKITSIYSETELHYKYIIPFLFIEEYIDANLHELKVHCIHGEPILFNIIKNSNSGMNPSADQSYFVMYDLNWNKLNFTRSDLHIINTDIFFNKPSNLDKIKSICRKLTEHIDYVRLDFFITDNEELYFGEYTFTPAGLGPQFTNPDVEQDMLDIYTRKHSNLDVFDKYILSN